MEQQILELTLQVVGTARIGGIRHFERDGAPTGKSSVTIRYEGGSTELVCPSSVLGALEPGFLVDVWLDVEPYDCGYDYQGRHVPKAGFSVVALKAICLHAGN